MPEARKVFSERPHSASDVDQLSFGAKLSENSSASARNSVIEHRKLSAAGAATASSLSALALLLPPTQQI